MKFVPLLYDRSNWTWQLDALPTPDSLISALSSIPRIAVTVPLRVMPRVPHCWTWLAVADVERTLSLVKTLLGFVQALVPLRAVGLNQLVVTFVKVFVVTVVTPPPGWRFKPKTP